MEIKRNSKLHHYRLQDKLAAGGFGEVWTAFDENLEIEVAIKLLKSKFLDDAAALAAIRVEAKVTAQIQHPNVCRVVYVGEEQGQGFYVMDYLRGQTLRQYATPPRQMSFAAIAELAIAVLQGLDAAHKKQIVHRDLKPENIMMPSDGDDILKILDFGIAAAAATAAASTAAAGGHSTEELARGTPGTLRYMDPESTKAGASICPGQDIYSLAIMLWEQVTGRRAFGDSCADNTIVALYHEALRTGRPVFDKPLHEEEEAKYKGVPSDWGAVIDKALSPKRADRYRDAAEMLRALAKVGKQTDVAETPINTLAGKWRVTEFVAAGGSGAVFRVVDTTGGAGVYAIKFYQLPPHEEEKQRQTAIERFNRGGSVLIGLKGLVSIPTIIDKSFTDRGVPYLVMEFIEGETFDKAIPEEWRKGGFKRVVELLQQTGKAADALHEKGVVHRDIKPGNMMLRTKGDRSGEAVLIDFSIVGVPNSSLTGNGKLGTPGFMSAEQLSGTAGPRADQWGFGAMVHLWLTGQPPGFDAGRNTDLALDTILENTFADLHTLRPDLPRAMCKTVMRALANDPAKRFETIGAFLEELQRTSPDVVAPAAQSAAPETKNGWKPKPTPTLLMPAPPPVGALGRVTKPKVLLLGGALLLLSGIGGMWAWQGQTTVTTRSTSAPTRRSTSESQASGGGVTDAALAIAPTAEATTKPEAAPPQPLSVNITVVTERDSKAVGGVMLVVDDQTAASPLTLVRERGQTITIEVADKRYRTTKRVCAVQEGEDCTITLLPKEPRRPKHPKKPDETWAPPGFMPL